MMPSNDTKKTAAIIADARRGGYPLDAFPGAFPQSLEEAYAVQFAAIDMWNDGLAGWKVGRITGETADRYGTDRLLGPIFSRTVLVGVDMPFPIISGGFGAFEAELVIVIDRDVPAGSQVSPGEALDYAGAMHVAIEVAGSPLAPIASLGPLATIAAFGNNMGLIVGPEIKGWRQIAANELVCRVSRDGELIASASVEALPGGYRQALAFAINTADKLGRPLKKGQFVSTGAITGLHPVSQGEYWNADFHDHCVFECHVEAWDEAGPCSAIEQG